MCRNEKPNYKIVTDEEQAVQLLQNCLKEEYTSPHLSELKGYNELVERFREFFESNSLVEIHEKPYFLNVADYPSSSDENPEMTASLYSPVNWVLSDMGAEADYCWDWKK
jgi:hypothetical protein